MSDRLDPVPKRTSDRVVRAMTRDGAFRVLTAVTTQTVRSAALAQEVAGRHADRLGQLITGAVLLRETVAPGKRVQILVKDHRGRTSLVADAHPDGRNRGIVQPGGDPGDDAGADVGGSILEVIYTLPNGVVHQGMVALPHDGDISAGLMTYMQESEQIVATIAVAAVTSGSIRAAGGYLVQLMPDADREALAEMTVQLEAAADLRESLAASDLSADGLRDALLAPIEVVRMSETVLRFGCTCSRRRILNGLAVVGGAELADMIAAGEPLAIRCDACRKTYRIEVGELHRLRSGGVDN